MAVPETKIRGSVQVRGHRVQPSDFQQSLSISLLFWMPLFITEDVGCSKRQAAMPKPAYKKAAVSTAPTTPAAADLNIDLDYCSRVQRLEKAKFFFVIFL